MTLSTMMSMKCVTLNAQETIIDQNFDEFTEGSESSPSSTDISGYTGKLNKTIGWNGRYVYEAGKMLMIGDGGNLETGYLSALSSSTNIKVTFDVKSRSVYGGACTVSLGYSASETLVLDGSEWHKMSLVFERASSYSKIKFEPLAAFDGILIDNVKVEAGDMFIKAPEALQPTTATTTSFTAIWNKVTGATSYLLDVYTKDGDSKNHFKQDEETTGTSLQVDGLSEDKTYYYTVRAKKGEDAISDYSNEIEVVEVLSSLPSPVAKDATEVGANGFTANWEAVDKAVKYEVLLTRKETINEQKTVNVLEEDFSKVTTGTLASPDYPASRGYLDQYTKIPGWYQYAACLADGHIGIAPLSTDGYITTPSINLSSNNGNFSVTLNMAETVYGSAVSDGKVDIMIYDGDPEDGGPLKETKSITLTEGFTNYTVTSDKGTADTYIKIYYKGSNKIYIDNMSVAQTLQKGDILSSLIETREVTNATSAKFEVPVTDDINYSYCVIAYARTVVDGEIGMLPSSPSNAIEVKPVSTSITNVSQGDAIKVVPATGGVNVILEKAANIDIYDIAGRKVSSVKGHDGINFVNVNSGIAIVRINGKSFKVIIK